MQQLCHPFVVLCQWWWHFGCGEKMNLDVRRKMWWLTGTKWWTSISIERDVSLLSNLCFMNSNSTGGSICDMWSVTTIHCQKPLCNATQHMIHIFPCSDLTNRMMSLPALKWRHTTIFRLCLMHWAKRSCFHWLLFLRIFFCNCDPCVQANFETVPDCIRESSGLAAWLNHQWFIRLWLIIPMNKPKKHAKNWIQCHQWVLLYVIGDLLFVVVGGRVDSSANNNFLSIHFLRGWNPKKSVFSDSIVKALSRTTPDRNSGLRITC